MSTCSYIHDNGTHEPAEPCTREAKYAVQCQRHFIGQGLPLHYLCDWHVLQYAYEEGLTKFMVTDIRGEAQKWEDAKALAESHAEDQAQEERPF